MPINKIRCEKLTALEIIASSDPVYNNTAIRARGHKIHDSFIESKMRYSDALVHSVSLRGQRAADAFAF
jgi:hypothetical protein